MKVLHLFQEYLSISESWAFNLLNNLNSCQHCIGAIYYNKNQEYFPEKFQFIELPKNLRKLYKEPDKINYCNKRILLIKRRYVKQEFAIIKKWIKGNTPNLLHLHFGTTAAHFLPILNDLSIPFIVSFYGYDYQKAISDDLKLKARYQKVFKLTKAVIIEEKSGRQKLLNLGCPSEKITICRLGVDIEQIMYRKPKFGKKVKLIQIANFNDKKGQSDVVIMFSKYLEFLRDKASVTLIGDINSDYGESVKTLIKNHNLEKFITIIPPIPYIDIHKVLEENDIFIHPSRFSSDGDSEGGAPTILLDAQAVGLPIISTTHCDIPQYIPESNHDLLVEEKNVDHLFRAVKLLLEDRERAINSSLEGRKHVEANFNIKNNGEILESKYKSLIPNNKI